MAALWIEELATGLIGPVSFDIAAGEYVALMGSSGAGKSVLLRAIVDLDPSAGNVRVGDRVRSDMPAREWRKLVALVLAESGWWADRVGEWEVSRLSTGERQLLAPFAASRRPCFSASPLRNSTRRRPGASKTLSVRTARRARPC